MSDAYQAGEPYADSEVSLTGLREDLIAIGRGDLHKDLSTLIGLFTSKGQPVDDRQMTVSTNRLSICLTSEG
jgi:hypothetical protein